ncbi:MAG: F0F1 ATP synthase subunit delta [Rhodospirillaceae bacterium]|nr:F0F1 ATP synthase subunit delta [Rhodospirillaceae bacterium]
MAGQADRSGGLAARYAAALYDLADEHGALDAVAGDLKSLQTMIDGSDDFRRFLKSPVLSRADQSKAIKALGEKAQLSPLTQKFLGLTAANRRLFALSGIIAAFLALLATRRGEVTAEVTSAVALSDAQTSAITAALKQTVGRTISLTSKIDASILGGLIVRVGSRMVDSSIKSKLQRLKLVMKGVG